MKIIFTAVPITGCEQPHHANLKTEEKQCLSCSCGLAGSGAYAIKWNGPGLGLICEDKKDAKRKAYMMNVAWDLAKGGTGR